MRTGVSGLPLFGPRECTMPILERMVIIYPPFHIMLTEVNTIPTNFGVPCAIAWHKNHLNKIIWVIPIFVNIGIAHIIYFVWVIICIFRKSVIYGKIAIENRLNWQHI